MQPLAIRLIRQEHRALAAVLSALRAAADPDSQPDFEGLRAMLFYLDDTPARLHHVAESQLLFPRIRERCPALQPVLDRLEAEHTRGEHALRALEQAVTAWQRIGDSRRTPFQAQVQAFTSTYLGHLEVEENYVLPVAGDFLSAADWQALDDALRERRGAPDETLERSHRALLSRIVGKRSTAVKRR